MKNIILLFLLLSTFICNGQVIYEDRGEYERALKNYNDWLDSYNNYQKKLKFYREFKYPKSSSYPENAAAWYAYFKPHLDKLGIIPDNDDVRIHENVRPYGKIHINFIEDPNSDYLLVKITDTDMSPYQYKYCATTYSFVHPGEKPIFYSPKKETPNEPVKIKFEPKKKEPINPDSAILKTPITKPPIKNVYYIMPDGKKYNYDNLIKVYPSMVDRNVLSINFRD